MQGKDAAKTSFEEFYKAAMKQDKDSAQSYLRLYTQLTGKEPTERQIENRVLQDLTDKIERGELSAKENINALTAIKRMKDIVNNRPNP